MIDGIEVLVMREQIRQVARESRLQMGFSKRITDWFFDNRNVKLRYAIAAFLLALVSLFSLYIVWPGFFQADHQITIAEIAQGAPSEWHSLVWGYLAFPLIYLSPSYGCYGFLQIFIFVVAVIFSIYRLEKNELIKRKGFVALLLLFMFSPTYLCYNMLFSSDVIFAILLVPFMVMMIELMETGGKALSEKWFCIVFVMLQFLLFEMRKNAVLIFVFTFILMFFALKRNRKLVFKLCGTVVVLIVGTSFLFGTILHAKKSPSQEMLSVPAQQIGRTVAEGRAISDDAKKVFSAYRSMNEWGNSYTSYTADPEKAGLKLNGAFVKAWLKTGIENPGPYIRAYLDLMSPYWKFTANDQALGIGIDFAMHRDFTVHPCGNKCDARYVSQFASQTSEGQNVIARLYNVMVDSNVPLVADSAKLVFFNRALPLWCFVIGCSIALYKKRFKKFLFVSVPLWCTLISLLCFSPVASFRYALQTYYILPIAVLFLTNRVLRNR